LGGGGVATAVCPHIYHAFVFRDAETCKSIKISTLDFFFTTTVLSHMYYEYDKIKETGKPFDNKISGCLMEGRKSAGNTFLLQM
jgi:hypothetical protein